MGGYLDVDVIKDGADGYEAMPVLQPSRREPHDDEFAPLIGISVDEADDQHDMNATIASSRRACRPSAT